MKLAPLAEFDSEAQWRAYLRREVARVEARREARREARVRHFMLLVFAVTFLTAGIIIGSTLYAVSQ